MPSWFALHYLDADRLSALVRFPEPNTPQNFLLTCVFCGGATLLHPTLPPSHLPFDCKVPLSNFTTHLRVCCLQHGENPLPHPRATDPTLQLRRVLKLAAAVPSASLSSTDKKFPSPEQMIPPLMAETLLCRADNTAHTTPQQYRYTTRLRHYCSKAVWHTTKVGWHHFRENYAGGAPSVPQYDSALSAASHLAIPQQYGLHPLLVGRALSHYVTMVQNAVGCYASFPKSELIAPPVVIADDEVAVEPRYVELLKRDAVLGAALTGDELTLSDGGTVPILRSPSKEAAVAYFSEYPLATKASVTLLQPQWPGAAAIVVALELASDQTSVTQEDVAQRRGLVAALCDEYGIACIGDCSDGYSASVAFQRSLVERESPLRWTLTSEGRTVWSAADRFTTRVTVPLRSPVLPGWDGFHMYRSLSFPLRVVRLLLADGSRKEMRVPYFPSSDAAHLGGKIKNHIDCTKPPLAGHLEITLRHLRYVIDDAAVMQAVDLSLKAALNLDRQNFKVVVALCHDAVIAKLYSVPEARATAVYLSLLQSQMRFSLDPTLPPFGRLRHGARAYYGFQGLLEYCALDPARRTPPKQPDSASSPAASSSSQSSSSPVTPSPAAPSGKKGKKRDRAGAVASASTPAPVAPAAPAPATPKRAMRARGRQLLTTNAWDCLEANFLSYVGLLDWLTDCPLRSSFPVVEWLRASDQCCESLFRALRSVGVHGAPNMNARELLSRLAMQVRA